MGVLRLPRPAAIYVPNSPSRTLTTDMISPPLSPSFNFDAETVTASIIPALDYISSKLQQRMMHVTLLVGRGKPYPTGQASDLMVIPITPLDTQLWKTLYRTVEKGARKFSLGQSWTDALSRSQHERHANEYLVQQSIMQNEVVFSSEGLTLLNMDRIYTFKRRLCILSHRQEIPETYLSSCVELLHRTILDFQGRPFSKAFFHRVYEQLDVDDSLLAKIAEVYKSTYAQEGVILPPPKAKPAPQTARKSPRTTSTRRPPPPKRYLPAKRGPKTPLSASDVTPITRNEWNMLVRSEVGQIRPTVTKWTPSPTVLAAVG